MPDLGQAARLSLGPDHARGGRASWPLGCCQVGTGAWVRERSRVPTRHDHAHVHVRLSRMYIDLHVLYRLIIHTCACRHAWCNCLNLESRLQTESAWIDDPTVRFLLELAQEPIDEETIGRISDAERAALVQRKLDTVVWLLQVRCKRQPPLSVQWLLGQGELSDG